MRPIPFTSEQPIQWPATVCEIFKAARPLYWLALLAALVALFSTPAHAATVTVAGQTCQLSGAYERSDASLVVDGCGTVYVCVTAGASYSAAAVLSVPGACSIDRIFRGEFQ